LAFQLETKRKREQMDRFATVAAPKPARRVSRKSGSGLGQATQQEKLNVGEGAARRDIHNAGE
jgi:hypothetical protein